MTGTAEHELRTIDPERDDRALFEQAGAGNQEAFRRLYQRHVRPVYWLAHSLMRDRGEAEEVTQEVFLAAWDRAGRMTLAGVSLLPWLLTTCRYQANNRLRLTARRATVADQEQVEAAVSPASTEELVEQRAVMAAIEAIVAELSDLDQAIYRSCLVDGERYQDAAAAHGVSHSAVRNRLGRIRQRLRTGLGPVQGFQE